ncbi:hypothetical protein DTO212C5_105 [Paecilomyces variotii]|nr:hypothetical protein DTO212C5_105 [Paecilomyces variotii]
MTKRRRTEDLDLQSPIPDSSSPEPRGSRRQAQTQITAENLPTILTSSLSRFADNIEGVLERQRTSREGDLRQALKDELQSTVNGLKNEIKGEIKDEIKQAMAGLMEVLKGTNIQKDI